VLKEWPQDSIGEKLGDNVRATRHRCAATWTAVLPGNVHALASCDIGEKFAANLSVPLSLLLSTAQIQRPVCPFSLTGW
jgi:hypothetical protein